MPLESKDPFGVSELLQTEMMMWAEGRDDGRAFLCFPLWSDARGMSAGSIRGKKLPKSGSLS